MKKPRAGARGVRWSSMWLGQSQREMLVSPGFAQTVLPSNWCPGRLSTPWTVPGSCAHGFLGTTTCWGWTPAGTTCTGTAICCAWATGCNTCSWQMTAMPGWAPWAKPMAPRDKAPISVHRWPVWRHRSMAWPPRAPVMALISALPAPAEILSQTGFSTSRQCGGSPRCW